MTDIITAEQRRIIFRERFSNHLIRDIIEPSFQSASRSIPRIISDYDFTDMNMTEMRQLSALIKTEINAKWFSMWDDVNGQLSEFAVGEAASTARIYGAIAESALSIPAADVIARSIRLNILTLSTGNVTQAGLWETFIKRNVDDTLKLVDGLVKLGWQGGFTNQELVSQLRGKYDRATKKYVGGILNSNQINKAKALVRTGTSHYSSVARDSLILSNSDIIDSRVLFATFDSRTSDICIARHLKEWDIDDKSYPRLPFHFNERSVYVFKLKGEDLFPGKRASKGAEGGQQVDANLSIGNWLKTQPRSFVEQTLGIKKASLFLDDGFSIDRFSDANFVPMTLKEILGT